MKIDDHAVPSQLMHGDSQVVTDQTVVVGHDGSPGADEALRYALDLADDLHAPVAVVRSWQLADAPRPSNWQFGYVSSLEEVGLAAWTALVADVSALKASHPAVEVSCRTIHAGPVKSLLQLAQEARLLVVGSRGLGEVSGILLGSVSEECVRTAACPVLVVRSGTGGQ